MNKFWNVADISENEGELLLYGDVCSETPTDWWTGEPINENFITPKGFLEDIEPLKNKSKINVRLNSCGGDLFTGIAIHNVLKGLKAEINVIVEGIAASAASVIMCAGDTVQVYDGSLVMIHGVSVGLADYYNIKDLQAIQNSLEANEKAIANIYARKTGKSTDELLEMIAKETWFTGSEAIENGFADELIEGDTMQMTLNKKNVLFVNGIGHELKGFKMPKKIKEKVLTVNKTVDIKPKKEVKTMNTVQELINAYPNLCEELVKNAKNEAVTAERTRIKEIEEIENSINDAELVKNAKYGENPMNAEKLAFEAMKKNAVYAKNYIVNQAIDYEQSNADEVEATPTETEAPEINDTGADIAAVINAVKQIKGGK